MRRVTADSNIYISALNFGGKPLQILELATGDIQLAVSDAIITETSRVLHHKFYWTVEDVAEVVEQILRFTKYLQVDYTLDVVPDDPADNRVLEAIAERVHASPALLRSRVRERSSVRSRPIPTPWSLATLICLSWVASGESEFRNRRTSSPHSWRLSGKATVRSPSRSELRTTSFA